ncbi:MAG: hypothetical protein A3J10_02250 [Candidatus Sungbacteria bacterium RIFCSPLOWO2_02_FULL_54_10]|uniref:Glycosyltransferase subfamily 4-like N-terminal domain-containing protein n=2 Tax=Candidatus Sungiibacteriota TaxID=1817917 RepID=A0A1G2L8M6_9BACT|nr:MAG: hypothetical protein A2679_03560 [Candidatus Sungbacteria bacterium RIFCSPHIGHO2_01_FULL_54_26]OHA04016.1 MAG: hypothetical protein A3C92_03685 [Candidatus Sungbacteria bacterium RIFCSPHIGHO2_02_FULL_53_17]OHA07993.1 MAG: hypothetical protein A3B34_00995 [Candidatus Sungbacteria bacterium RIFCSPLOWO2_01_FULL_54_21]OHA14051.1 MAG: hypothetical protein A3J10_02250 [Candidatus Sungbacteria bacterium RIFCSPLOWO2_02_FULL_54_10]
MKTILIPITSNFIVRSFLRADTFSILAGVPDMRLVLLAPAGKVDYYRGEFPGERVVFVPLPPYAASRRERFWRWAEIAGIHTRTAMMMQYAELFRRGSAKHIPARVVVFITKSILRSLGQFRWWRYFLRKIYAWFPADRSIAAIFHTYSPSLVYAPTMLTPDMAILKEAKKRGIPTVGMALSWDNLYSKTILRVHPDVLLAHTDSIKHQAETLGDYPAERIRVIGIPQYDRVFRKQGVMPRDVFLSSLGGDPNKKMIVYALSGKQGLAIEYDIIEILSQMRADGRIPADTEVLVRPYPRFDLPAGVLERIKKQYGFLAEPSMAHAGTGKDSWEFDEGAIRLLTNTLWHADVIITMYSTFFIEGAACNKPLVGIAFDGGQKNNFWNSARRFFAWDHLADIRPLGGITLVKSEKELAEAINDGLTHPEHLTQGRAAIVAQQCVTTDGKAGERVAALLLQMLQMSNTECLT